MDEEAGGREAGVPLAREDMQARAEGLRALIGEASQGTVIIRQVGLELAGRRVMVTLVTPDLLTLQDVLDETRAALIEGESAKDFNARYLRRLVPKVAYASFDLERMEGALIFPRGHSDPVYRRLTRHPTAFAALTMAAAEVVRPLQMLADTESSFGAPEDAGDVRLGDVHESEGESASIGSDEAAD